MTRDQLVHEVIRLRGEVKLWSDQDSRRGRMLAISKSKSEKFDQLLELLGLSTMRDRVDRMTVEMQSDD